MNEENKLNSKNLFTMTLDTMRLIERKGIYSGDVKKKFVLEKLEDIIGDNFEIYKPLLEQVIDGIIILSRNKNLLQEFNKIKCCR